MKLSLPKYYGAITNRDFIKVNKGTPKEEKRPFWEFLDEQPDGWLCSLAYLREDAYPESNNPMIWDCGAWTYKEHKIPQLNFEKVTAEWAVNKYSEKSKPGDFIVAPDHMFTNPDEITYRRKFNRKSAREFLPLALDARYQPMAVVHGVDVKERVRYAKYLVKLGYESISLGGLAYRASSRKAEIYEIVSEVRQKCPDVWLHVLGLSAPSFANMWKKIGVQSFDGASHFKQAFTGGAFFTVKGIQLVKHQAARTCRETFKPIEEIVAPECNCLACTRLRSEGIDTRTYGSNENNMGRAAHNLNMLMSVHKKIFNESASFAVQKTLFK